MKNNFKILVLMLAVVMVFIIACSKQDDEMNNVSNLDILNGEGFPLVKEPVTFSIFGQKDQNHADWSTMPVFSHYQEMTGVILDFQEAPAQGFDEKKNLLFASNDLPDIFFRSWLTDSEISMYGVSSKQLIPLEDLIKKYAPNLTKILDENPLLRKSLTAPDGHIYTIPEINFADTGKLDFKQWINKNWLSAVGKEIPKTIDEFKDVLIAFRDEDPNGNGIKDEIPLGMRDINSVYQLAGSFGLEYQFRDTVNIEDGNVHFWLKDKSFKEWLQYLNELYEEDLLWTDFYKRDLPAWRSNLSNALFGAMYMPYSDVFLNVEDQFIGYDPLIGPSGEKLWSDANTSLTAKGAFAVSTSCKYPEVAIRWVDYFFSDEGAIFFAFGKEGETFYYDNDGIPRLNDDILNAEEGYMTALGKINTTPGTGNPRLINNMVDGIIASDLTKKVSKDLVAFLPDVVYPKPILDEITMERVNFITQDLVTYRDESVAKFIVGELDFGQWSEYCATLDQIGLSELEKIYQDAFDSNY